MTRAFVGAVICVLAASPLQAQTEVAERLRGRVPAEVVAAVERLAADAPKGVPVDPLVQKAIEGSAKGVPAARVVAALEVLARRLESSLVALRGAGVDEPDAGTVEAGAFALGTGIGERELGQLARLSRPPHTPEATLRVAGALAALGVPHAQTVELVAQAIDDGGSAADVVNLPAQVQAGIGRGLTPGQAASAVGQAARSQRPAQPPRGPPEGRPPHPPKKNRP
ncbi:MAG TPA: hypothetical protein VGA20_11635 [Gemmatimonadales bacterium]